MTSPALSRFVRAALFGTFRWLKWEAPAADGAARHPYQNRQEVIAPSLPNQVGSSRCDDPARSWRTATMRTARCPNQVGSSRCDDPARAFVFFAGGFVWDVPLARPGKRQRRTSPRAIPTKKSNGAILSGRRRLF